MVAAAMGDSNRTYRGHREWELDLRGTLGIAKEVPVGFERISLHFDIAAPEELLSNCADYRKDGTVLCSDADADPTAELWKASGLVRIRHKSRDLLVGTWPFKGRSAVDVRYAVVHHTPSRSLRSEMNWRPFIRLIRRLIACDLRLSLQAW